MDNMNDIDYKEAQDFEKSAFVVSLKDFRDLENRYKKAIELAFASDALPSEKILKENQRLKEELEQWLNIGVKKIEKLQEDLEEAYNFTDLCIEEMFYNGSYEKRLELQEKLYKMRNK
jgi:hypothetical protein